MDDELIFKGNKNPKIKSSDGTVTLKFGKGKEELSEPNDFEHFIKSCEKLIRTDPRYKNYISHLKENGLDRCTFFGNITTDMATIEMHHGPLFTLYDLCSIVTDSLLSDGEKICTFDVADIILEEHEDNHVQVVMLTKTPHQLFHDGKIFINYKQAFGDIMKFIKKFKKGIRREHLYTLERYIELCEKYEATDNDFLKILTKIDKYVE